ncbi:hypothetical protein [Brachyspira hampsonii]|uniref:hypothetical protein n=1 Tax=Brachyspira hampsonii TaxID=1287055 RepID=UPI000A4A314D|nr:hypothetical protein [Brachyspira hampsonii]
MKKIFLLMSVVIIAAACKSAPVATGPEENSGFKTTEANNQNAKGLNLPDGATVRETPRGKILVLHDPKSKAEMWCKPGSTYEVKFGFDNTIEIGTYKDTA